MSSEQNPGDKTADGGQSPDRRALLKRILQQEAAGNAQIALTRRPAGDVSPPLSFAQEGLWFLDRLTRGRDSYRLLLLLRLDGRLDMSVLQRSLCELVRRHEVLRSVFPERDGRPVIVVSGSSDVPLPCVEIDAQTGAERDSALDRLLRKEYSIPFDLSRGPLLRARLIEFAPDAHVLMLMVHHIAADGWSSGVLYQELTTIYEAFVQGRSSPLPDPTLQYTDFAAWQRQRLQGPFLDQQLAYWKEHLRDAQVLELPKDRPQAVLTDFEAVTGERTLPGPLGEALRELSRREGVTLFVAMLAAFEILLNRYSGQDDIVIGTPLMVRNRPELESMVGLLINMVALRLDLGDDPTFRGLLRDVRRVVVDAQDHSDVPFEKVVQALQPERVDQRNPLFQVVFALDMGSQPGLAASRRVPGLSVGAMHRNDILTHLDLEAYLRDTGDTITVKLVCASDMFEGGTVTRMLEHYVQILESVVSDPDQRISDVTMLKAMERQCLLEQWGTGPVSHESGKAVHELIEAQVARDSRAPALVFGEQTLTYGELSAQANRLAHYLIEHGVGRDVPVAVLTVRRPEMVIAQLAILKAGGAYLPIDPEYPAPRARFMLEDAGAPMLLTQAALLERVDGYTGRVLCLDTESGRWADYGMQDPEVPVMPEDLAYVIYTSGSTGRPKGVEVTHRGLSNLVSWHCRVYEVGPQDRATHLAGLGFDASVWELWPHLAAGATVYLVPEERRHSPGGLWTWMAREGITLTFLPTPLAEAVLREPVPEGLRLRVLMTGGDRLHGSLRREPVPFRVVNHYGPTENSVVATCAEIDPLADDDPPIGSPIDNVRTYVLDAHLRPVPVGVPGELYIGGESLARGYLNLPELTAEKFVTDPFRDDGSRMYRTGDKVRYRPDGTLEFVGRFDHQVKLRGFRIELGEIEALLGRQPGVEAAVVVLREDTPGDRRLAAYLVPDAERPPAVEGLRTALQGQLPAYMVPGAFVLLEEFPLTPNGKVDHKALPMPRSRSGVGATIAPRTDLEAAIATIWKEVLGAEDVGVEDNFFDIGGHSLLLVQVHERIMRLTGSELPIATLFEFPTVRTLATHLRGSPGEESPREIRVHDEAGGGEEGAYRIEPIAVIGMAGRFPDAGNLEEFWANLRDGVESIRFFSRRELEEAGIDPSLVSDRNYVPAKGYLENADLFDAEFFGYSPREAELIDPQQRLFLESAWQALETTGYDPGRYPGRVGVYAGASINTYQLNLSARPETLSSLGGIQGVFSSDKDFLPTRVSYKLNLRGPSVNVQTACSTSLVAVHQACRALLTDECDMALAGGVSVSVPLVTGYLHESGSIASPDGHCRAFDADAQGTVGGNGVGVVVLKRLSQALSDGDTIHAVIRGSTINNDGAVKVGYTAPSVEGQSRAIAEALRVAGVDPASIDYIETHGTGTTLGDPIEIAALRRVFGENASGGRIALGALKSSIGHLDAAAGVAGLIKTVLALEHGQLPPSANFHRPNPELHLESTPFYVNTALAEWKARSGVRRAGVSSFGIGGTNAHVVVEEPPPAVPGDPVRTPQLLVWSARTPRALEVMTGNLADALARAPETNIADVAYTLQTGRKPFRHARIAVCRDTAQAIEALRSPSSGVMAGERKTDGRPVAFMFPGQGSQHLGMARGLYESESLFRGIVDECAATLRAELDEDIREVIYPPEGDANATAQRLTHTRFAQPALFVIEYALAQLWWQRGIRPVAMIGHSLGEYVAACIAGVMSLDEALGLVAVRARMMSGMPGGKMLAVPLAPGELESVAGDDLSIATLNGPALTVLSGPEAGIERAKVRLAGQGVEARVLHTSHAFHSAMMEPVMEAFREQVAGIDLQPPRIPYLSNVTGDWIGAEEATDPGYYARHLRRTVRFAPGLERLFAHPEWALLEVGPGQTLSTLARRHPARPEESVVLSSSRHPDQAADDRDFMLETTGRLWLAGVDPDWQALHAGERRRRVALPTYPFERARYWIESRQDTASSLPVRNRRPDDWVYAPSWRRVPGVGMDHEKQRATWLLFRDGGGLGAAIETELLSGGADAVSVTVGERFERLSDRSYVLDPQCAEHHERLIAELRAVSLLPEYIVHLWSVDTGADEGANGTDGDALLARGFFSLIHLAQALEGTDAALRPAGWVVVTTGVHEVDGTETLCPEKAMAMAPCKVLGMEYPGVRARSIDVVLTGDDRETRRVARLIADDIRGDWREPVVAYRGRYRWAQAFEPMTPGSPADLPAWLRRGGVYVIIGGLGEVGYELSLYLASTTGARLALIGRNTLPDRALWSEWLDGHPQDDAMSRRIRRAQALEAAGAEVLVLQADATDAAQLAAAMDATEDRFGTLHGVIHAAGAEKKIALIKSIGRADCEEQFRPKLDGMRALEQALRGRHLDFCVVNSSLASILGAMGFVAYTAAHLFLDVFVCRHNSHSDTPWITINWDNWSDGGDERTVSEFHMVPQEAVGLFGRLSPQAATTQYLVSTGDLQARIKRWASPPAAERHQEERAAQGDAPESHAHPRPNLSEAYEAPRNATEEILAGVWQAVLGIDRVGIRDNFFDLGGDSVLNIQITAKANEKGLKLTPRQVFEHQTIAELAAVASVHDSGDIGQEEVTGPVPLTPIQHWFFEHHATNPHHFNLSLLLEARRPLDRDLLEQSLARLASHHDALRLRYSTEDGDWRQRLIAAGEAVPVHVFDLGDGTPADQDRQVEEHGARLQQDLDIVHGPLVRAVYFDLGDRRCARLLLVLHHLVVDIVSWRILLEDLTTIYDALAAGREPALPPKTLSIKHWAEQLAEYACSERAESELGYWSGTETAVAALPVDGREGSNDVASSALIMAKLDAETTRTLVSDMPRAFDASVNDALLTALARAVATWTGQAGVYLDLEGHGRESLWEGADVSRTVGWFTTLYPLFLEWRGDCDIRRQIEAIRDRYRAVPNHGMGFGVLRYLNDKAEVREQLERLPGPQIAFLYAGQMDQAHPANALFRALPDNTVGAARDPSAERAHLLEVNSAITGGRFRVSWTYSTNRHETETIRSVSDVFMETLRDIAVAVQKVSVESNEGTGFTAGRISEDDLAEIMRQQEY